MYDFLKVQKKWDNKLQRNVYTPSYVLRSNIRDLLVRGGKFYAIFNYNTNLWEMDDSKAVALIDQQVEQWVKENDKTAIVDDPDHAPIIQHLSDTSNKLIIAWHNFCERDYRPEWDMKRELNQKVIFSNQDAKREDYATIKLDYPLQESPTPNYDRLCEVLYLPSEQEKWEWFVGCILSGDQRKIQKMLIFYGEPGSGKSTILEKVITNGIFNGMDNGYVTSFEANNLTGNDSFGTDFLAKSAVLATDNEAEMQLITKKAMLNKIISHETITVNPKFGKRFSLAPGCVLIAASNEPVQMSPTSGMNRRIIDIRPTGNRLDPNEYDKCVEGLQFERSGMAFKCLATYKRLGRHYYDHYIAEDMLSRTSPFQNYVQENYFELKDGISLAAAYKLYTDYAEESNFKNILPRYKFRDTLKLYFEKYENMKFSEFKPEKIGIKPLEPVAIGNKSVESWIQLKEQPSILDKLYADCPAQYEQDDPDHPLKYSWANCYTKLKDLDTHQIHYLKGPVELIFLDFDMRDKDGNKDLAANIEMASKFPPTYAEVSKSGGGLHLYYIYTGGDPDKLSRIYGDNVEVKVMTGGQSIRRKLTLCNDIPVAEIDSGLPLKEEKGAGDVIDWEGFKNEKILRSMIVNALQKKHHGHTKPEVDYIYKALEEAYKSGSTYDVRDLENDIFGFAVNSTNKAQYCMSLVNQMHFCSKDIEEKENVETEEYKTAPIIMLDVEISPSAKQAVERGVKLRPGVSPDETAFFLIEWKYLGDDKPVTVMPNPKPSEVEKLFRFRIIAHNGIAYDSNMCYAASQGYSPEELYELNLKLTSKDKEISRRARFPQARHLFYADTYEYPVKKQNLKKWEIELGKTHLEWNYSWEQPVPMKDRAKFAEYCKNDVISLEAVFNATHDDFVAKEMLVDLVPGGSMIDATNTLSTKFVQGGADHLQLVYTDFMTGKQYGDGVPFEEPIITLDEYNKIGDDWTGVKPVNNNHFPGYHCVWVPGDPLPHNFFRGIDIGRGGYVYANHGMYRRGVTRDSLSHHPTSIEMLNLFGDQTINYSNLKKARAAIKHKDFDTVRKMFGGKLSKYLDDAASAKALSKALKLVLNAAYGMTSSQHDYFAMKDKRNVNNIVALRGAMVLKIIQDEVEARGFTVIHIKTDSIKIADPTDEIIKLVDDIGAYYGYTFETEHTWNRICLVDDAQFIGLHDQDDPESPMTWDATGKEFQVPYIFKTLFTHEPIEFKDLCTVFNVSKGSLHLVHNAGTDHENDEFIGRVGEFVPMQEGHGGKLYRVNDEGKRFAAAGTTGYLWEDADKVKDAKLENFIDMNYFRKECDEAIADINRFGNFDQFVDIDIFQGKMNPPE